MTTPTESMAARFPSRVRFVNGRTRHRVQPPAEQRWWDLLHAACGKSGYKTDAYVFGQVPDCRGCVAAVAGDEQENAA